MVTLTAHRNGALVSIAAALLWTVLAWRTPSSTHHFAPLVAAGAWGYLARYERLPNPTKSDRLVMWLGGFSAAAIAQLVLTVAEKLNGPPLIASIPVPAELLIMAVLGATIGAKPWQLLRDDPESGGRLRAPAEQSEG